jgi:hypothetical protein
MFELYFVNNSSTDVFLEWGVSDLRPVRLQSDELVQGPWHPLRHHPQRFYEGHGDVPLTMFLFNQRMEFAQSFSRVEIVPENGRRYYIEIQRSRVAPSVHVHTDHYTPSDETWPWWLCALLILGMIGASVLIVSQLRINRSY